MGMIGVLSILEDQPYRDVKRIWKLFEKEYNSVGVQTFNHPNITFQGGKANDVKALARDFRDLVAGLEPFEIEVDGIGRFGKKAIFLKVKKSNDMIRINKMVNRFLKTRCEEIFEQYTPNSWVPHITLAMDDLLEDEFEKAYGRLSNEGIKFKQKMHNLCLVKKHPSGKIKILKKYKLQLTEPLSTGTHHTTLAS